MRVLKWLLKICLHCQADLKQSGIKCSIVYDNDLINWNQDMLSKLDHKYFLITRKTL